MVLRRLHFGRLIHPWNETYVNVPIIAQGRREIHDFADPIFFSTYHPPTRSILSPGSPTSTIKYHRVT